MSAEIIASDWRFVEVGRVVLLQGDGPYAGRLATVVEIIDHKRVCGNQSIYPPGINSRVLPCRVREETG